MEHQHPEEKGIIEQLKNHHSQGWFPQAYVSLSDTIGLKHKECLTLVDSELGDVFEGDVVGGIEFIQYIL